MLDDAAHQVLERLVEHPDEVSVRDKDTRRGRALEVRVHPDDLGKVIGRAGRTAKALRTVVGALGPGRSVRVDFLDVDER